MSTLVLSGPVRRSCGMFCMYSLIVPRTVADTGLGFVGRRQEYVFLSRNHLVLSHSSRFLSSGNTRWSNIEERCRICQAVLKSCNPFACSECDALRIPPDDYQTLNLFTIFGIAQTFRLDLKALAQKHKDLQRFLHPDKFMSSGGEDISLLEKWSPFVNEAYTTLKKPIRRANYLLVLAGRPLLEDSGVILDENFLAEIVELNEEIAEAETSVDVAGLHKHVYDILQTYYDKVEVAFDIEHDIEKARRITAHMQYYENLKKKLAEREIQLGIVH